MDIQHTAGNGGRSSSAARTLEQVHRYKRLLRAYWWMPFLTVGLSLGAEWIFLQTKPQSFFSIGRMTLSAKLALPNATYYSEELNNFFGTQVELMQSDTVQ